MNTDRVVIQAACAAHASLFTLAVLFGIGTYWIPGFIIPATAFVIGLVMLAVIHFWLWVFTRGKP